MLCNMENLLTYQLLLLYVLNIDYKEIITYKLQHHYYYYNTSVYIPPKMKPNHSVDIDYNMQIKELVASSLKQSASSPSKFKSMMGAQQAQQQHFKQAEQITQLQNKIKNTYFHNNNQYTNNIVPDHNFKDSNQNKNNNELVHKGINNSRLSEYKLHHKLSSPSPKSKYKQYQYQQTNNHIQNTPNFPLYNPLPEQHCKYCLQFEQQRVHLQTCIQKMGSQLQQQFRCKQNLQQKINDLKSQQDYLMSIIESIRDKQVEESTVVDHKMQRMVKNKQQQLNYANKEINKLKEWLKEEKSQVFRSIQCVKIKDVIIENLQKQIEQLKQKLQGRKKPKKKSTSQMQSKQQSPQKQIIQQNQLQKHKNKCEQLQNHVYELTTQIDTLRHQNAKINKQLILINNNRASKNYNQNIGYDQRRNSIDISRNNQMRQQQQIHSPIDRLISKKKKKSINDISGTQNGALVNQDKKYKFVMQKCSYLQNQIQKLLNVLQQSKAQNYSMKFSKNRTRNSQKFPAQSKFHF